MVRAALLLLACWAGAAQGACRQALALGLDVSGSVDAVEYRLQMDGLAGALMRPEVQAAFLALPQAPVRLYVFEWAGFSSQRVLMDWTEVQSPADLANVAGRLSRTPRMPSAPATAIGQAMLHGAAALARQPECWRHTLDLSGDGRSNTGPRPRDLADEPMLGPATVNALVIGPDPALMAYFEYEVIRGQQAFVEVALGFQDFEEAMTRKLLKELQTLAVSELSAP